MDKGLRVVIGHAKRLIRRQNGIRSRVVGCLHMHVGIVRHGRADVIHLAVADSVVGKVFHPAARRYVVGPGHEDIGLHGHDGRAGMLPVRSHIADKSAEARGVPAGPVPPTRGNVLQHAGFKANDLGHGAAVGTLQGHGPQGCIEKVQQSHAILVGLPRPAAFQPRLKVLQRARHKAENISRQHGQTASVVRA